MYYSIRAHYIPEKLDEFFQRLTDGSISGQKPDGEEIVASMKRAVITAPGIVEWSEMCFCAIPLQHERQTVYDYFFTEMEIHEENDYRVFKGQPFMGMIT